ncbi:Twitching mobility protein [Polystyrenella longa]|uniref:Twitching mobility protein n=1 Tax=Polystyrenella longa TaxID=2528007 RepID=A0A518CJ48_9PLAN|nr:PilT/PilU family type 4a pilus ATPase [Polystyrenella longa]QDU79252.1 Twitching mobility protein [Polystyrenella longa]
MATADAPPAKPAMVGPRNLEVDKIFRLLIKFGGSDLHMQVGKPPVLRIKGTLRELDMPAIDTKEKMEQLFFPMMDERNRRIFHEEGGADFAHIVEYEGETWRFRVNLFIQLGNPGMVSRKVERFIPNFEGLNLPPVMESLCKFDQGMVLLAGVTGSGKSTTIASMLNWVNANYRKHILTIEDPIEFVYTQNKCLINQREVGMDVKDFEIAMKHAVRQDPDIMLVGEMRDRETFETAMHAAETGHLVFGTIHASSAPSTIGRILDLFPQDMHRALRSSMAFNMKGIVAQKLLPTIREDVKRVPVVEIMTFNPTVRKLIVEGDDGKLPAAMRIGKDDGMQLFNDSLYHFIENEFVSRATAFEVSPNVEELKMMLKGIQVKGPAIL